MLVHLDLFSGIGGFALACQWAGIETIGFVEIDKYCQKILKKHWPSVPIVEDIRDVRKIKEIVANTKCQQFPWQAERETYRQGKSGDGGRTHLLQTCHKGTEDTTPTILITGGFPCQPFSVAGKRRGTADNRYLWNEMFAVIKVIKPTWVLAENVAGIAGMEFTDSVSNLEGEVPEEVEAELSAVLDRVCSDLEEVGYEVQPIIIPACAINAPHRRDRVWIVANSKCDKLGSSQRRSNRETETVSTEYWAADGTTRRTCRTSAIRSSNDRLIPWQDVPNPGHLKHQRWDTIRCAVRKNDGTPGKDEGSSESQQGQSRKRAQYDASDGSTEVPIANTQFQSSNLFTDSRGNTEAVGKRGQRQGTITVNGSSSQGKCNPDWWAVEPELGRVAHGIPNRVDRLKCLGNAIVPQVAYEIIKVIADNEDNSLPN